MTKICSTCKQEKPVSEFHKRKASPDGLRPNCKVCKKAVDKAAYIENKDAIKEKAYKWASNNVEKRKDIEKRYRKAHRQEQNIRTINYRARQREACDPPGWKITPDWWRAKVAEYDGSCCYCGAQGKLTMEHVVPLNRGGKHASYNLLPACPSCNYSKADKTPEEWGKLPRYSSFDAFVAEVGATRAYLHHLSSQLPVDKDWQGGLLVFSDEWKHKQDLIKAMISYRLGKFSGLKLSAGKCELLRLNYNMEMEGFFDANHLDGHAVASFGYGLFWNNKLVCCASVRRNFNKEWELARFATDPRFLIRGGAQRLIKAISKEIAAPLVTFSNNRLGSGNVYKNMGFEFVKDSPPSYWYTDGETRLWRFQCKRINDPEVLAKYPTELAQARGGVFSRKFLGHDKPLHRVYDKGHKKWVFPAISKQETT